MGVQISREDMAKAKSKETASIRPKRPRVPKARSYYNLRTQYADAPPNVHIQHLPSELLCTIFSYFTIEELFCTIRPVCRRWRDVAMSPVLWKSIDAGKEVPSQVLYYWLQKSPLLKSFVVRDRNDLNNVLELVSKHNRKLESIKVHNCWGSEQNCNIKSKPLCNLVSRCQHLGNYHFNKSNFTSCKFFKLISCDKRNGRIMKRCNYVGPMSVKQMKTLFFAIRNNDINDSATIGNNSLNQKFKLKDLIRYFEELEANGSHHYPVWENLFYGEQVYDPPLLPMEMNHDNFDEHF